MWSWRERDEIRQNYRGWWSSCGSFYVLCNRVLCMCAPSVLRVCSSEVCNLGANMFGCVYLYLCSEKPNSSFKFLLLFFFNFQLASRWWPVGFLGSFIGEQHDTVASVCNCEHFKQLGARNLRRGEWSWGTQCRIPFGQCTSGGFPDFTQRRNVSTHLLLQWW